MSVMKRFAIALVALTIPVGTTTGQSAQKPNVLFIAVDDLNDWVGCMEGHPQARTPTIDRLAARGVLFANAHCTAPACNPSRAAVFSGRMPQVTGVWSNRSGPIDRRYPNANLLPRTFSQAGYRTLGTGKLLHSRGKAAFDEYFGTEQRWSPLSKKAVQYTDKELPTKGTDNPRHVTKDSLGREVILPLNRMPSDRGPDRHDGESFDWGPWDVPDSHFGDTLITDWAIEKIKQAHEKPIFLGVGYYRPHIPLWAPRRFFDRFADSPGKLPLIIVPPKKLANRFAAAGSRCDQPVGLIDIYPTLVELCSVAGPDKLDGQSLVPLLSDPNRSTGRGVVTAFDPGNVSLRTERWRYIRYADGSEELYDLNNDPSEWSNLAGASTHNEKRRFLRSLLDRRIASLESKPSGN